MLLHHSSRLATVPVPFSHALARPSAKRLAAVRRVAEPTFHVLEHRVILFDSIGLGPHWCCHCGRHVNWGMKGSDRLVVDHLNFDPYDNDLDNLGQSCQRCNAARSCALEFEP